MSGFSLVSALEPFAECPPIPGSALCGPDERTEQDTLATKPYKTSRIARLAGLVITVVGMAVATASWASITSSENPSTDGSYTISWSAVPNASSHQLYEDGTLVYDSTGTSRSFSGKAAGDYEYTVGFCEYIFDEEMCYGSGYTVLTVTVSPPSPTVDASFDESSIALGESAELSWSSTNANSCSGSPAIGSTSTSGTKTYTPSSAGTFSVKVTCTGAGGSGSDTASVTVHAPPTVDASFDESSIALGESAELSWSSTNANSCSGSPAIGSTSTSGTKTYTPSSAGTFSVTVRCTGAGGSGSDTASVTVHAPPTVDASFDESSIALGESAELSWSSTNANSCSGSPAIGSTSTSGTKTYTPTSADTFSVKVTCTGAGGSGSDTASVTVHAPPTVDASFDESSIALGESAELSWSSTNANSCSGSPAIGSTSTSGTKTYTLTSAGTFSVKVRCTGAGGSGSDTARVTVHAPPTVSASFDESSITLGESVELSWSSTNATACSGSPSIGSTSTSGTKTYTPSSAGSFSVRVTCRGAGGSDSATATVTVKPSAPTLTVPSTDSDGRYTVSWTSVSGATSYKLDEKSGSGSFTNIYSGSGTSRNITGKADGTYSYRVRACSSTCGDWSSTATVSVGGDLTASPNPSTDGSYTVSWTAIPNAESYQLYEDGTLVYDSTGTSWSFSGKAAGSYEYTLEFCELIFDEEMCFGSGYAALTVTVTTPPLAPTLTVPATDADGTYDATWTSPSGATSYKLQEKVGSGGWSASENLTTTTKSYTGKTPAIYMYRVRACAGSDNCGDWSSTGTTKVPPGVPILTVPATDADGRYPVSWTSPSGATSYKLQEKSGSGSFGGVYSGSGTSTNITGKTDGTYSYRVRACAGTGNCGGWSSTKSVEVSINRAPAAVDDSARTPYQTAKVIDVLANDTDADDDDLTVTAVTTPTSGTARITSNNTRVTYTPQSGYSGADTFDYTVSDGTDSDTASVSVTVNGRPEVDAEFDQSAITLGDSVTLSWRSSNTSGCGGMPSIDSTATEGTKTYTPSSAGTFEVTVTCTGPGTSGSASDAASVTVNTPPVAVDDTARTAFETAIVIEVLANDSDADGDDLTVTAVTTPANGTAQITADADGDNALVTYTPQGMYSGADTFRYTVSDGTDTASAAVSVTVNTPPTVLGDTARTAFETAIVIEVLANDSDADGDDLTVTAVTTPTSGTARITSNNTRVTYTPQSGYSGADTFDYTVSDGTDSDTASVSVTVNGRPEVDAEFDQSAITLGDSVTLSWRSSNTSGCGGMPSIDSTATEGTKTYTPSSAGTFEVTVTCTGPGTSGSASDAASVTVNTPPVAVDDTARTAFETAIVIEVLANDSDADGDDLTVTAVTTPTSGTARITSNNTRVTYTPQSGYSGADTFDYTVSDGTDSDTASVSVTVNGRPEVDAEFDQSAITLGDSVTLSWRSSNTSGCGGMPSIDSTATEGTKTYTPSSAGTFEVTVTCTGPGTSGSASDAASVTVNTPPVAVDDTARTAFETAIVIEVLANDSDADGDDLTVTAVTTPANGTAQITADADGDNALVTYTPQGMYSGADTFRYTVSDGTDTASAAVSVTVNTPPTVLGDTARTAFETAIVIEVLANDSDADGDDLTVTAVTMPTNGTAAITADADGDNALVTYTPQSMYSGADTFRYTVSDGTDVAMASVSVTVNTPPTVLDDTAHTAFETAIVIEVLANDSDADGDDLTVTVATTPTNGTATITADADGDNTLVTYTPQSGYSGADTFDYTVSDGTDTGTGTGTVSVTADSATPPRPMVTASFDQSSITLGESVTLTWSSTNASQCSGMPSIDSMATSGTKMYTPSITGSFSVTVTCTGAGGSDNDTASVTVTPASTTNTPPVAADDTAETPFDTAVEIAVLANDTDADGDDLTVTVVTAPANGTAMITSDADGNDTQVTYTPPSGYTGEATFDYTVSDGTDTDTGSVRVTVNLVKVTPNPSTTGSYTLSWLGTIPTDRYWVLESVPGGESLSSFHSTTSVDYTGKATGEYTYDVFRCQTSPGPGEICEEYGSATAEVILPITPGNLPYRSGVTKGGDAYVNVPIAPVPGVNGLAPRLSIDYSGGRERHRADQELPADMIGYGWRVGGFSTIRRCVKGTDDSDGISFNSDDALCLDGEPLTKINDTQHLEGGAEYRTARESFAKVLLKDNTGGTTGSRSICRTARCASTAAPPTASYGSRSVWRAAPSRPSRRRLSCGRSTSRRTRSATS